MALKVGSKAPDFTLASTNKPEFTLSKESLPIILYFYPKDFTPGCTKEACSFKDHFSYFKDCNVKVVGISRDPIERHRSFKKKHELPFELLSDSDGSVCQLYDALIPVLGIPKRITYLIDKEMKILTVHDQLFGYAAHVKQIKDKLDSLQN